MSFRTPVLIAIPQISALSPVQSAFAQTYPTKRIHMIVPYPAGGGTDFFARLVGQKISGARRPAGRGREQAGRRHQSRRRFRR